MEDNQKIEIEVLIVKKWWTSRTLWTNIAIITAGVLTMISGELTTGVPITIAGVINSILRVMTQEGIEF